MKAIFTIASIILFCSNLSAQVPKQKLDFPSTRFFGILMDVSDDGQFYATVSAGNGASTEVYIYELINGSYELIHRDKTNLELDAVDFTNNNLLVLGEGLGSSQRKARIITIELTDQGEWIKHEPVIEDPEEIGDVTGSAYHVSKNGNVIALGVPTLNKVYVYDILSPTQAEVRTVLEGDPFYQRFGQEVGLSADGQRLSITTFNPKITEVYEYQNGEWELIHSVELFAGHTRLSEDGKSLMVSNGPEIQVHTEDTNGKWEASASLTLEPGTPRWNIISSEFYPEYGHITVGMLNASNQSTKLATVDLVESMWLERRSPFYDMEYSDYGGTEIATSIDGSLLCMSRPRVDGLKGEVYILNDLEGSALGVAAYRDKNRNGIMDDNESYFTDCTFTVNDNLTLYAMEGYNYASVYGAMHDLAIKYDENTYMTTTGDSFLFDHASQATTKHLFGVDFIEPQAKAKVSSSNSLMICNTKDENVTYIRNTGTEPIYVEVELDFAHMEFIATTAQVLTQSDSTVIVKTETLQPGESSRISTTFQLPDETFTGLYIPLYITAKIYDADNDNLSEKKELDKCFTLRCSYDPNDKAVYPAGRGEELLTLIDQELTYKIRFQNTGNFPATNVVVKDAIDENLDLSTFSIVETSHRLTQVSSENRNMEFIFENIMLPDSVNNEPESHGYILYTIRPYANIADYTPIENTANIYFDFNEAIVTNSTLSNMVEAFPTVSVQKVLQDENGSSIYPNPISDALTLSLQGDSQVTLYDQQGKVLERLSFVQGTHRISTTEWTSGVYLLQVMDKVSKRSQLHTVNKM